MICDIVVAHHREYVGWLHHLNHQNIRNVYVYSKDKHKKDLSSLNNKIIQYQLPNIGREGHTYLTHIVNNYSNLPDIIIFLQGFPYDHGINNSKIFSWINDTKPEDKYSKNYYTTHLTYGLDNGRIAEWKLKTEPNELDMISWFKKFIRSEIETENYYIYFGGNFFVSKDRILSQPIEKYNQIINELNSINPEAGHYLERSWYYLFNLDLIS